MDQGAKARLEKEGVKLISLLQFTKKRFTKITSYSRKEAKIEALEESLNKISQAVAG